MLGMFKKNSREERRKELVKQFTDSIPTLETDWQRKKNLHPISDYIPATNILSSNEWFNILYSKNIVKLVGTNTYYTNLMTIEEVQNMFKTNEYFKQLEEEGHFGYTTP